MKEILRRLARLAGFEVFAYNHRRIHELRKAMLMRDLGVSLVLDVGANTGQYGQGLRELGYKGRIVSFEPIPAVFEVLQKTASTDGNWETMNLALGDEEADRIIHVAEFSQVSSLLPATGASITGGWKKTKVQAVSVRRIDALLPQIRRAGDTIYLKLDTQGFEQAALDGSGAMIFDFAAIELEASTIELYEGETLLPGLMHWLACRGFSVFSIGTLAVDHMTGRVLQFELLVKNENPRSSPARTIG